jgi:hypothetical protein
MKSKVKSVRVTTLLMSSGYIFFSFNESFNCQTSCTAFFNEKKTRFY